MLLSGLLTHFEQNVLDYLSSEKLVVTINGKILIKTLLDLELVEIQQVLQTTNWKMNGEEYYDEPVQFGVALTEKGRKFIALWKDTASSDLILEKALV